jgi:preprotein translocase subunit SecE
MWRVAGWLRAATFLARSVSARLSGFHLPIFARPGTNSSPSGVRTTMADPLQFIQEVRQEASKVTWPTRRETLITTGLVIAMVVLASLFFLAVDEILQLAVRFVLNIGH